jgi:hypothetical protein
MRHEPPEKQGAQVVDNQRNVPVLFLGSLLPARRGWEYQIAAGNVGWPVQFRVPGRSAKEQLL